jgi:hypothetical protein
MKRFWVVAGALAFAIIGAAPAFAHGTRTEGELALTVGWANEPALVGQPNAVQLEIARDGEPVLGAEETLKVAVLVGSESTDPLALRAVFDAPGEYRADIIPTVVGGYTFRFTGKVGDADIDRSFSSRKDGFDEVTGTTEIAFPKQAPSTTELASKLAAVQRDAEDAKSSVATARMLGIGGLVVGIAGVALAISRRRA